MSEEQDQEAQPSAETNVGTPIPGEAPPGQEQGLAPADRAPVVNPDVESRARRWGWVPKEQWRGPAEKWTPADEFVRKGEEYAPIARDMVRRSEQRVTQLEQQMAEQAAQNTDTIRRLEGMTRVALNKQREQLWAQFEGLKAQAVEQGDTARYHALSQQQAQELQRFQPEADVDRAIRENPTPAARQQPDIDPVAAPIIQEWIGRNPWFGRDVGMTKAAEAIHGDLMATRPGLSINENLAETEKALRAAFPHKFGGSPAPAPNGQVSPGQTLPQAHAPPVEGGGRQPGGTGGRVKGWSELPPEAKKSAESFIRNDGLFLPPNVSAETATEKDWATARTSYAKSYWEQK